MSLNIDEIYDLFSWDASYSEEEYEARVERGIGEAIKLRNLYPFMQPVLADRNSKTVWEPCAKLIALKSDEDLDAYMYLLLAWLKDMNWPGADVIFNRLSTISYDVIKLPLEICLSSSKKSNDTVWEKSLIAFESYIKTSQSYQSDN